jgi:hypothetical protein
MAHNLIEKTDGGNKMKSKSLVILSTLALALVLACWVGPAAANTVTINTPAGATEIGGNLVNAQAVITTSDYDAVTHPYNVEIVLTNNLANPKTIAQCLSDFGFVLTDFNQGSGAIAEVSNMGATALGGATPITVNANGTYTLGAALTGTANLGWGFSETSVSATTFLLQTLGTTDLIIGASGGGGTYSNANSSIAGSGPHNPLLSQTADFFLYVPGVDSTTGVGAVTFSFGTSCGNDITVAPIPPAALLLGSGLLGLVGLRRFRKS